jgi:hypothetical protein
MMEATAMYWWLHPRRWNWQQRTCISPVHLWLPDARIAVVVAEYEI